MRGLLIGLLLVGVWYWLQIVHEFGHVAGALATGGSVVAIDIPLIGLSHTEATGGRPLVIVWAGPLVGASAPLAVWVGLRQREAWKRWVSPAAFFATLCLAGNGLYLCSGVGDASELVRLGAPAWSLWLIGGLMCACAVIPYVDARMVWRAEARKMKIAGAAATAAAGVVAAAVV